MFGAVKIAWSQECLNFEARGGVVNRNTFLPIFGAAYISTVTSPNILSGFAKTGVHPFSPDAIKAVQLAPAEGTSTEADAPIPQPTVVRRIVREWDFGTSSPIRAPSFSAGDDDEARSFHSPCQSLSRPPGDPATMSHPSHSLELSPFSAKVKEKALAASAALQTTSFAYLASNVPIDAVTSEPPPVIIEPKHPLRMPDFTLLKKPKNEYHFSKAKLHPVVNSLQLELDIARIHPEADKRTIRNYSATMVLQGIL